MRLNVFCITEYNKFTNPQSEIYTVARLVLKCFFSVKLATDRHQIMTFNHTDLVTTHTYCMIMFLLVGICVSVSLSVPVLTCESLDQETSFPAGKYSFKLPRSGSHIKVIRSRSRSHKQKMHLCILFVDCILPLKGNLVLSTTLVDKSYKVL